MEVNIFYSWQSDLPNNTNRGFIFKALENAAKQIRNDALIKIEPRVDKDTEGVSGSPNIPETILEKIDSSGIFVCDVSVINGGSKFRHTPNPNVLFELGYALKSLGGWERIVMVFNEAFGRLDRLPFDLPSRRVIPYFVPEGMEDKSEQRNVLTGKLRAQTDLILSKLSINAVAFVGSQPVDTILDRAAKLAAEQEYSSHKLNWSSSYESVSDAVKSAKDIFDLIDEKTESNATVFSTLGLTVHKEEKLRSVQTTQYGCQVELKGFTSSGAHLSDVSLSIVLYKKIPVGNGYFKTDAIREYKFSPDLDRNRKVVWKENEGKPYSDVDIVDRCFQLLFNQIENPEQSLSEQSQILTNALGYTQRGKLRGY